MRIAAVAAGREVWVDTETSLRTRLADGADVFDVNNAMACVGVIVIGLLLGEVQ